MSKGSKQRPIENKEQFDSNWDKIFKPTPCQLYDEERIDIIGSNGNTGEHYTEDNYDLPKE